MTAVNHCSRSPLRWCNALTSQVLLESGLYKCPQVGFLATLPSQLSSNSQLYIYLEGRGKGKKCFRVNKLLLKMLFLFVEKEIVINCKGKTRKAVRQDS